MLLARISWKLTLACAVMFPLYGLVFAVMNPRVRQASERMNAHLSRLSGNVSERLAGQAVVKTYTAEEREARRFARRRATTITAGGRPEPRGPPGRGARARCWSTWGRPIVIGYGGWLALSGELSAGMLTRFLGYVVILYGPVRRFAELNSTYQTEPLRHGPGLPPAGVRPAVVESPHARRAPPPRGDVRFEDGPLPLHARQRGGARPPGRRRRRGGGSRRARPRADDVLVLDGVTLHAEPGQRVAIVGASGAGKTTLVSLLPRLYDVTGGRILIDGVDVRDYGLHALRSAIAIVQQDSFVFTGSIRDNIAYGRPDAPAIGR